jgi:NADH-quinone oxidoreductase subunit C
VSAPVPPPAPDEKKGSEPGGPAPSRTGGAGEAPSPRPSGDAGAAAAGPPPVAAAAPPKAAPSPAPVPPPAPPAPSPAAIAAAARREEKQRRVLERLRERFGDAVVQGERTFRGDLWIDIAPGAIHRVLEFLRDDPELRMKQFVDLTCADYLKLPDYARDRFGLTYILYSYEIDTRARLKVWLGDADPEVESACDLFGGANWAEREVWDLYGIRFRGHPGLKRILMPDDYEGHPLRKDYPLKGRGERDSFPVLSRRES